MTNNTIWTYESIINAINNGVNIEIVVSNYFKAFLSRLFEHKISIQSIHTADELNDKVIDGIGKLNVLRDEFIAVVDLFDSDDNTLTRINLVDFFGKLFQRYEDEGITLFSGTRVEILSFDHFRFFNQSLFISLTALLIENKCFRTLAEIIHKKYPVYYRSYRIANNVNFIRLREYNYTLNQNMNTTSPQRISLTADYILQGKNSNEIEKLVSADILLYYLSLEYRSDEPLDQFWYPELSVFNRNIEIMPLLISKNYFEQVKVLFGVQTVIDYKTFLDNTVDSLPRDNMFYIPYIKDGLLYNKVASKD